MITALDPKTALVLIDLQNGVLQGTLLTLVETIISNAQKLVTAFRKANLPIVFVTVDPAKMANPVIRRDAKTAAGVNYPAEALQIVPGLDTREGDIFIVKHTWSAFYDTPLQDELQKRGITGIVLGGVITSVGVEGTARAASERGYNIAFAQDAMTDRTTNAHEHSLKMIFPRIGEVGDTDDIIAVLRRSIIATH